MLQSAILVSTQVGEGQFAEQAVRGTLAIWIS
jgi:hypothetical protein